MKESDLFLPVIATVLFAVFMGCLVSSSGKKIGRQEMRIEAVKAGVAEWVPQPDGTTVFAWKAVAK